MNEKEALSILHNAKDKFYHTENGEMVTASGKEYEEAVAIVEKRLKALEIIKRNGLHVDAFQYAFEKEMPYKTASKSWPVLICVTKDEFDLLKEVLS